MLNYVLYIQIAFQLLNPFPMQKIRTKRAYHSDIVKVSWFTRFFLYEGVSGNVRIRTLPKISEEFREPFQDYRVFLLLTSRPRVLIVSEKKLHFGQFATQ